MRTATATTGKKLGLLVLSAVGCIAAVMILSAVRLRDTLHRERELESRNLVDVAYGVLEQEHALARAGLVSEEDAMRSALAVIERLRYGESGYFWVSDGNSRLLVHPFEPELVANERAPHVHDARAPLAQFAAFTRASDRGFVDYAWPRPGGNEAIRKRAHLRVFRPWGWIVGTGVYVDDVEAAFRAGARWLLMALALIGAAFVGVAYRIARSILDPLGGEPAYVAEIANRIADGQLDVGLQGDPGDRRTVVDAMARMVGRLRQDVEQVEEELARAARLDGIGRLAGGVAHDFNNLLVVVLGAVNALREGLGPDHPLHDEVVDLGDAAERAATLTRQLLAFGRRDVVKPVTLDLEAAVSDASRVLGRLVGEDVELVLDLAREPLFVVADPARLQQVLLNLVVNARDAMPRGGSITVETRPAAIAAGHAGLAPGEYAALVVRDTGCGMSLEVQRHIFEPFFTTKGQGRGTGLGLATVFGIVTQAGGHVEVESTEGAGTSFRVLLPRVQPPAPEAHDAAARVLPAAGGQTILVVEDEGAVLKRTAGILERAGYVVVPARGPDEAVALHGRSPGSFDLLLTDVIMPVTSGPELAGRLREKDPQLRVLLMSGYTDEHVARHGSGLQGVCVLEKPFDGPRLLRAVGAALATKPGEGSAEPLAAPASVIGGERRA